ncbi:MAG TPA: CBS domain-containing protein [Bryobacteraceae bacterium]|jgi:CBS domain-containing protein|nr:CBS domain-containing protein [Bryobacteraceae bacterium]
MELEDTVRAILDHKGGQIWYVSPETSVYEALEIMDRKDIGALLVMSSQRLLGIFSERDYSRKVILKGKASKATLVGEIMSGTPVVEPNRSVEECMRLMTEFRIRHLPVVEDEIVVGVVSIGDLVNWTIHRQEEHIQHLHHYIAGSYPG